MGPKPRSVRPPGGERPGARIARDGGGPSAQTWATDRRAAIDPAGRLPRLADRINLGGATQPAMSDRPQEPDIAAQGQAPPGRRHDVPATLGAVAIGAIATLAMYLGAGRTVGRLAGDDPAAGRLAELLPTWLPLDLALLLVAVTAPAVVFLFGSYIATALAPHPRPWIGLLTGGLTAAALYAPGAVREGPEWTDVFFLGATLPASFAGGWLGAGSGRIGQVLQGLMAVATGAAAAGLAAAPVAVWDSPVLAGHDLGAPVATWRLMVVLALSPAWAVAAVALGGAVTAILAPSCPRRHALALGLLPPAAAFWLGSRGGDGLRALLTVLVAGLAAAALGGALGSRLRARLGLDRAPAAIPPPLGGP